MALPKDIIPFYLHPDYVDNGSDKLYSNNRCPLSMLAETCNSIGKILTDNHCSSSQDSNFAISPSCSSSCSAPKFSPHSLDLSPLDSSKPKDGNLNEKRNKEKSRKRKFISADFSHKRMPPEPTAPLNSPYSISDFLKMNIFPPKVQTMQDQNPFASLAHHLQSSSQIIHHHPKGSPIQCYPSQPPEAPSQIFSPSQAHLIHELHNLYNYCQHEKRSCDCALCFHQKTVEPTLFDSLCGSQFPRPTRSGLVPNFGIANGGSSIKYCMYCGRYIPDIQGLLKHIQAEHFDQINSNFQPKSAVVGNLRLPDVQSSVQKSREMLRQLYSLYGSEGAEQIVGGDLKLLIR